ncbi:MAG: hypothetical protein ACTSVO_10570 [Candidatus Heimdallarchaeaceae archaeon]
MSGTNEDDFPLYMSSVNVKEDKNVELEVSYSGEYTGIDNVFLIGNKNGLVSEVGKAKVFTKEEEPFVTFKITIPIWEDGNFQAVVEKEGKYIYEPGESHNLVFRGRGVFLDLRKIFHLTSDVKPPKGEKGTKKDKKAKKSQEEIPIKDSGLPQAYDEDNMLSLMPRNFKIFGPDLKNNILQALDYLTNPKSQQLIFDKVILPDIARALKQCIAEEGRASVYDICFPIIILIEKALILSGMIHEEVVDEESLQKYQKEVVNKIPECITRIKNAEFRNSTDLIKKEYDDDVHELQNRIREEI